MPPNKSSQAPLMLNVEEFDRLSADCGWHTDVEKARGLGLYQSTISRLRSKKTAPSVLVIDRCLAAFGTDAYTRLFQAEDAA